MGAIHNEEQLFTPEIEGLQTEAERWKDGSSSDGTCLAAVRCAYSASVTFKAAEAGATRSAALQHEI